MRYLGIDLGDMRTGIALGDAITGIASPVETIRIPIDRNGGEDLLDALVQCINAQLGPPTSGGEIVIGLPLNMDGSEGPRAAYVRLFAERLEKRAQRKVHLHDERLSSVDADQRMARSGLTHGQKKRRRDALAAAAILRSFLAGLDE
ncbi:MAG: Holliday junction resolvase RuvX [Planctomycetota bacterium]|nr:MAG: Holliday junction resolvase RuvX [Planctomycetota bacterium]